MGSAMPDVSFVFRVGRFAWNREGPRRRTIAAAVEKPCQPAKKASTASTAPSIGRRWIGCIRIGGIAPALFIEILEKIIGLHRFIFHFSFFIFHF
jgi:hypothetical protein